MEPALSIRITWGAGSHIAQVPTFSSGILIHLVCTGARHAHAQALLKTIMIRQWISACEVRACEASQWPWVTCKDGHFCYLKTSILATWCPTPTDRCSWGLGKENNWLRSLFVVRAGASYFTFGASISSPAEREWHRCLSRQVMVRMKWDNPHERFSSVPST